MATSGGKDLNLREVGFPTDTGNDASISLHDISDELKKTSDYSLTLTVLSHNSFIYDILKINESGILRVGGGLKYSNLSLDEKYPIALPYKNPLTLFENTEWKFMPPKSPNFSGLWEAGVKSFKHLKRVVGNAPLTLEEFLTIILEIESVLNS
ncbi:hypothetical protein AVEN_162723-1 [Araneus ventricosus]|uniref:Uncharacterized protein n=1 Tax=Araneus ventricosus TaxID=182803 RepID=A0A4Y2WET6_ARAVE|nr:hypothetical protein AVEN_162723-1 [Araneus ventricosus]